MDPSNLEKQDLPEEPRFLDFPHLPDNATDIDGKLRLNKYSSTITKDHDFPGAQVGPFSFSQGFLVRTK
jgi:dihydroxy-acid dehydratase